MLTAVFCFLGRPLTPAAPPSEDNNTSRTSADPMAENPDADDAAPQAQPSSNGDTTPQPAPKAQSRSSGRPSRRSAPDWGNTSTPDPAPQDEASESGTPAKRKRGPGRPTTSGQYRGGFRGRQRKGAQASSYTSRTALDRDGNAMAVENDEVILPDNPEGDEKVNKEGELQGGREYRVRTFRLKNRGNRLYMLSTEPARCLGFRDSYLFFNKQPQLFKILLDEEEKRDLIDREILPHSYKGRQIGVVTARSVFREFGSKIVVGGRKITDDYKVDEARARGDIEGDLADPNDRPVTEGKGYNRNQFVAWHGASSVYQNQNVPMQGTTLGGRPLTGKRKAGIASANWMLEHATEAARFNSSLAAARRTTLDGVYDTHTNLMCYPKIMQPTKAKWERVPEFEDEEGFATAAEVPAAKKRKTQHHVNGTLPNGDKAKSSAVLVNGESTAALESSQPPARRPPRDSFACFSTVPSVVSRNFLIVDTHYLTPPHAALPTPGSSSSQSQVDEFRSEGMPDLSPEDLERLPQKERDSFIRAKGIENEWRSMWTDEEHDGMRPRSGLRIGVGII